MIGPKIVNKPWGKEVWIEVNDKYCFKKLHLNKGKRTSFQFHEQKIETLYLIDGVLEVLLENDVGELVTFFMYPGDFLNVRPPKKHRMTAVENCVYFEASTPEVDDVIRIEDDSKRQSGKIESEHESP